MRMLIAVLALALAAVTAKAGEMDVCKVSENGFVNSLGSASIGSSVTAYISGQVVVWKLTSAGWLAVAAIPGVPSALTGAALTASALYLGLKGYCGYDKAVNATSEIIEKTTELPSPTEVGTDLLCQLTGNCPEYNDW